MTHMARETLNIWEGIYKNFEEAGGSTDVFAESLWVERSGQKARQLQRGLGSPGFTPPGTGTTAYAIQPVVALLQAKLGFVRMLDFGGCVGFSFPSIVSALARPNDIEVHVVDNEGVCKEGRAVFEGDPRIHFHSRPPEGVAFDLVHCGSSIQYVSRWIEKLKELVATGPAYLVIDDLPAGDIETFASLQNYYGKKIPHWFFNIRQFVEQVERETPYRLCYKARYLGTFFGELGTVPMDNFPPDRRIDNAYNLVFFHGLGPDGSR
jgi:putative methyltransferase (TIGR04325 family)